MRLYDNSISLLHFRMVLPPTQQTQLRTKMTTTTYGSTDYGRRMVIICERINIYGSVYNGRLPCFLYGFFRLFVCSRSKSWQIRLRVFLGSKMSSTKPKGYQNEWKFRIPQLFMILFTSNSNWERIAKLGHIFIFFGFHIRSPSVENWNGTLNTHKVSRLWC